LSLKTGWDRGGDQLAGAICAGLPLVLGAAFACSNRRTVLLWADGSGTNKNQVLGSIAMKNTSCFFSSDVVQIYFYFTVKFVGSKSCYMGIIAAKIKANSGVWGLARCT
jgi:hypothetical protein